MQSNAPCFVPITVSVMFPESIFESMGVVPFKSKGFDAGKSFDLNSNFAEMLSFPRHTTDTFKLYGSIVSFTTARVFVCVSPIFIMSKSSAFITLTYATTAPLNTTAPTMLVSSKNQTGTLSSSFFIFSLPRFFPVLRLGLYLRGFCPLLAVCFCVKI